MASWPAVSICSQVLGQRWHMALAQVAGSTTNELHMHTFCRWKVWTLFFEDIIGSTSLELNSYRQANGIQFRSTLLVLLCCHAG